MTALWEEFRREYDEADQELRARDWSQDPPDQLLYLLAWGHAVVVRMDQCLPATFPADLDGLPSEFRERPHRWFYFLSLLLRWLSEGADPAAYETAIMPAFDYLGGGHARHEIKRRLDREPAGRAVAGLFHAWAAIQRGSGGEKPTGRHLTTLRKMIWKKIPDWQKLKLVGARCMDNPTFQEICRELESQTFETLTSRYRDHDVISLLGLAMQGELRIFPRAVADDIKDRLRWLERRHGSEEPLSDDTEEAQSAGGRDVLRSQERGPEEHAYDEEIREHLRRDRRSRELLEAVESGAETMTDIARRLGVSRQALWKRCRDLKKRLDPNF